MASAEAIGSTMSLLAWLLQFDPRSPFNLYWAQVVLRRAWGLEHNTPELQRLAELLIQEPSARQYLINRAVLPASSHRSITPARPWLEAQPSDISLSFPLQELICSRFSGDWEEFSRQPQGALAGKSQAHDGHGARSIAQGACSTLSAKISSSMVRVAATRIFADPTQSIMELPVNSIDSYRRMRDPAATSIGKFGMGFFSFLYWLLDHPRRRLEIISRKADMTAGWQLTIREQTPGSLGAELRYPVSTRARHGTLMVLENDTDPQPLPVAQFQHQMGRLRYIADVSLGPLGSEAQVQYELTPSRVTVLDHAEGMSLETLFGSLLVPSISTKTLRVAPSKHSLSWQPQTLLEASPDAQDRLVLTVGEVVVVELGRPSLQSGRPGRQWRVRLPLITPLPVSRDDILLVPDSSTHRLLQDSLWEAVLAMLKTPSHDLSTFFELLYDYAVYSGQEIVFSILDQLKRELLKLPGLVFVPQPELVPILNGAQLGFEAVYLPEAPILEAVSKLSGLVPSQSDYRKIFVGVTVVPLPGDFEPLDGGLPSLIFVPAHYDSQQLQDLAMSFSGMLLRPYIDGKSSDLVPETLRAGQRLWAEAGPRRLTDPRRFVTSTEDLTQPLLGLLYAVVEAKVVGVNPQYVSLLDADFNSPVWYINGKFDTHEPLQKGFLTGPRLAAIETFFWNSVNAIFGCPAAYRRELCGLIIGVFNRTQLGPRGAFEWRYLLTDPHLESELVDDFVLPEVEPAHQARLTREAFLKSITNNLDHRNQLRGETFVSLDLRQFPQLALLQLLRRAQVSNIDGAWRLADPVWKVASSSFEASRVLLVLGRLAATVPLERLLSVPSLKYLFSEMRLRYSPQFFHLWEARRFNANNVHLYKAYYDNVFLGPLASMLNIYLQTAQSAPFPGSPAPRLPPTAGVGVEFGAQQLIDYIFSHKAEPGPALFVAASHHTPQGRAQFQSIQIAVDSGTSKPFADSVLTELAQNSMDAIRRALGAGRQVSTRLEIESTPVKLSFRDQVGIEPSSWVYLLVPFLSSKTSQDLLSTGEMGTGFFNVYRQPWCRRVDIYSGRHLLQARPVLEREQVVDLQYRYLELPETYAGTLIEIWYTQLEPTQLIRLQMEVSLFVRQQLAFIEYPVFFNGQPVQIAKRLFYESPVGRFYRVEESGLPSLLLTNGVPMGALIGYAMGVVAAGSSQEDVLPELHTGLVVDINKNYYRPVQSRNRILGAPELEGFLLQGFYRAACAWVASLTELERSRELELFVPGTLGPPPPKSMPTMRMSMRVENFNRYAGGTKKIIGQYSFTGSALIPDAHGGPPMDLAGLIREIIYYFLSSQQAIRPELVYERLQAAVPSEGHYDLYRIVQKWFQNKVYVPRQPGPSMGGAMSSVVKVASSGLEDMIAILDRFGQAYYALGRQLQLSSEVGFPERPPSVRLALDGLDAVFRSQGFIEAWREYQRRFQADPVQATLYLRVSSDLNWALAKVQPPTGVIEFLHQGLSRVHEDRNLFMVDGQPKLLDRAQECDYVYGRLLREGLWRLIFGQ